MDQSVINNTIWVLFCTALVFLMEAGFCCLQSGLSRSKNSINVAIKTVVFLFPLVFRGTAMIIASGAVAKRMQFRAYLILDATISGLVYPLFGHWAGSRLSLVARYADDSIQIGDQQ